MRYPKLYACWRGARSIITKNRWPAALLCTLLTACTPASADVHYTTQLHWNGDAIFEAWVSGSDGRFDIKRSGDPTFPYGAVIFTRDSGNTAFLYSPESSECVKMTSDELVQFKRAQMKQMHITADGLKVERLADEDGPDMFNLKTHHYGLRLSVTMHVPDGASIQDYTLAVAEDVWTAADVHEHAPDLAVFTNSTTGIALLDDGISAELAKLPGFPLKRVVTATSTVGSRTSDMGQTAVLVTGIETVAVDKSQLDLPKGCSDSPQ